MACFLPLTPLACKKSPTTPNADVLNRPVIWLDTPEVSFAAYQSGGNPDAQSFQVKNSGKNTLNYDISDDADWLKVEPASGSSSGQLVEHTILVNKAGLSARDESYLATVMIVCAEAYNNPQRVTVSLKLSSQPPPVISVRPLEMDFSAQVGQNPSTQTLRVKNAGEGTLNYEIDWDASWLSITPAGGTSAGGEKSHTVSVNSQSLAKGNYGGAITVSAADASNNPQLVQVTLKVSTTPPPPPPSTNNWISISCNPSSGVAGTTVSVPITIDGNLKEIASFGLELTFDSNMFQYESTTQGTLTGGWSVGGGASGGTVTVGGFAGGSAFIPIGSYGSIAVVTLKVTGIGLNDGDVSNITIGGYIEGISGMKPEPASTSFTFLK